MNFRFFPLRNNFYIDRGSYIFFNYYGFYYSYYYGYFINYGYYASYRPGYRFRNYNYYIANGKSIINCRSNCSRSIWNCSLGIYFYPYYFILNEVYYSYYYYYYNSTKAL